MAKKRKKRKKKKKTPQPTHSFKIENFFPLSFFLPSPTLKPIFSPLPPYKPIVLPPHTPPSLLTL